MELLRLWIFSEVPLSQQSYPLYYPKECYNVLEAIKITSHSELVSLNFSLRIFFWTAWMIDIPTPPHLVEELILPWHIPSCKSLYFFHMSTCPDFWLTWDKSQACFHELPLRYRVMPFMLFWHKTWCWKTTSHLSNWAKYAPKSTSTGKRCFQLQEQ